MGFRRRRPQGRMVNTGGKQSDFVEFPMFWIRNRKNQSGGKSGKMLEGKRLGWILTMSLCGRVERQSVPGPKLQPKISNHTNVLDSLGGKISQHIGSTAIAVMLSPYNNFLVQYFSGLKKEINETNSFLQNVFPKH